MRTICPKVIATPQLLMSVANELVHPRCFATSHQCLSNLFAMQHFLLSFVFATYLQCLTNLFAMQHFFFAFVFATYLQCPYLNYKIICDANYSLLPFLSLDIWIDCQWFEFGINWINSPASTQFIPPKHKSTQTNKQICKIYLKNKKIPAWVYQAESRLSCCHPISGWHNRAQTPALRYKTVITEKLLIQYICLEYISWWKTHETYRVSFWESNIVESCEAGEIYQFCVNMRNFPTHLGAKTKTEHCENVLTKFDWRCWGDIQDSFESLP